MRLIEEMKINITKLGGSKGAAILAKALASACNSKHGVSILDVSACLSAEYRELVVRLVFITKEPDFCNGSQDDALCWLHERNFI